MGADGELAGPPVHLSPASWLCSCLRAFLIASAQTTCPTSFGIPCRSAGRHLAGGKPNSEGHLSLPVYGLQTEAQSGVVTSARSHTRER